MAQIVVYGHAAALRARIPELSDAIHAATVEGLGLPSEKRFHRFIPLDPDCFIAPADRTIDYTIVEVSMFEGRTVETKKDFIRKVIEGLGAIGIGATDVEITITETPRSNWGIRGVPADELQLGYAVDV
ncbi:MAG TPA: tautomerase family protein [Microbacteriaceae bacterium]|jgi:phenylpyruvate tautomerase PptA (4-oxalocrotonate tautomerase family)|nr:tautomerase family protein [Microbacteriaceae bacterium]